MLYEVITIYEDKIPISDEVQAIGEALGIDPLTVANEGKVVMSVKAEDSEKIRITSYNVCYTKLLRSYAILNMYILSQLYFGISRNVLFDIFYKYINLSKLGIKIIITIIKATFFNYRIHILQKKIFIFLKKSSVLKIFKF